jgi:hypothetical protein
MKRKEFQSVLKSITVTEDGKKKLSLELLKQLDNDVKNKMIQVLVSARHPVLIAFINSDTDIPWLNSMGYLYPMKGADHDFITHGG